MPAPAAGEALRRKYPCSVRGSGPCTMYVTDRRVALEPRAGAPAADVPLGSLLDWKKKGRRTIAVRWRDGGGRLLSADVRLGKKGGEACDPEEARMALFAAHTEAHPYGEAGMGFYRDERGRFLNRFGLGYTGGWEPGDDPDLANAAMYAHYESHLNDLMFLMVALAGGDLDDFDAMDPGFHGAMEEFVLRNGGRTLVEQELFARHAVIRAGKAEGRYGWRGLSAPGGAPSAAAAVAEETSRFRARLEESPGGDAPHPRGELFVTRQLLELFDPRYAEGVPDWVKL